MIHRRSVKGFTLIELLVVIGIVVLLAALLLPALQAARNKALTAGCLSNLRQIGFSLRMYLDDNDSYFPVGAYNSASPSPTPQWDVTWRDLLLPYADYRSTLYACPGSVSDQNSYGCNPWLSQYYRSISTATLDTDDKVWAGDHITGDWAIFPWAYRDDPRHLYLTPRHLGRVNILFVDGRAQTLPVEALNLIHRYWLPQ